MFPQIIEKYEFVKLAQENGFTEAQALFMFTFVSLIRSNYNSAEQKDIY